MRSIDERFAFVPSPADLNATSGNLQCFFQYLVAKTDKYEIKSSSVSGDLIQLTMPWRDAKQVFFLDPQKDFLPIRYQVKWEIPGTTNGKQNWSEMQFEVQESRLIDDIWTPVTMVSKCLSFNNILVVEETKILRMESGNVKPVDLLTPFSKGMQIADVIEAATYVIDAQGNPSNVKFDPNWSHKPPPGWSRREPTNNTPLWTSNFLPADRKRLEAERKTLEDKNNEQKQLCESALKVMRSSAPLDERVEAGLKVLRVYKISNGPELGVRNWALVIRELIKIGKPAIPQLTQELDQTERGMTLRALGFVLRGIDDPRAVPAMIRAIPKTLQPSASDFGLLIENDPELAQFMQEYDNGNIGKPRRPGNKSGLFSFGRPIREIMPTLEAMTGQSLGWNELNFAQFGGSAEQQRIQRKQFLQLAERWAAWWSNNWRRFVKSDADAQLDLIRNSLDRYAKSIPLPPHQPRTEFPCGPKVTIDGGSINNNPQSFDESPSQGFWDLDSGRQPNPPPELLKNSPAGEPSKPLLAWAEREGVDLVTLKIKPSGSDKSYCVFKPLGMKVWRIGNDRYDHLQEELSKAQKFDLPTPWEGLLTTVDEKTGKYDDKLTASFLFITKEGTCGTIQLKAPLNGGAYSGGGLHIRFIYENTVEKSANTDLQKPTQAAKTVPALKKPVQTTARPAFNIDSGLCPDRPARPSRRAI